MFITPALKKYATKNLRKSALHLICAHLREKPPRQLFLLLLLVLYLCGMDSLLLQKYNIPGPRYTSYPTVPYWEEAGFTEQLWLQRCADTFNATNPTEGISLYIHLPFCESLCTFCACHKRITKNHGYEKPYIDAVIKEWQLYCNVLKTPPVIKELHLGGGTPTFFSAENLELLLLQILATGKLHPAAELSFEGHPNNTTQQHLSVLYALGFKRVSFGVQDYNLKVQQTIHRLQPYEKVQQVTETARNIGYNSISHDLVFGLPHQTWNTMQDTILKTIALQPDRIAFYSYAHVPWVKGVGQRGFDENDLPAPEVKRELYEKGKELLAAEGYIEIGMDHFSLPGDSLYHSMKNKTLHRNFMGYSSSATRLMIGLGMSAISDSWTAFAQNNKTVEGYMQQVNEGRFPVFRGHILTDEDIIVRQHILNIMCTLQTQWNLPQQRLSQLPEIMGRLQEMEQDGLLQLNDKGIVVAEDGRPFIRNVAMAFDVRMMRKQPGSRIFSMVV